LDSLAGVEGSVTQMDYQDGEGNGTGTITVQTYSQRGSALTTDAQDGNHRTGVTTTTPVDVIVDLETTMAELEKTINTASDFYGSNIFAWNVQSFATGGTVDIFLINSTNEILGSDSDITTPATEAIVLVNNGALKGIVDIDDVVTTLVKSWNNIKRPTSSSNV
jgi:hypothetical protein